MKRFLATVLMLAATAAVVWLNPPENLALGRGVLQAVPPTFGPWSGTDYSFEDAVIDELKADDILIRRYERDGQTVWLCVVYHQNKRYGAHAGVHVTGLGQTAAGEQTAGQQQAATAHQGDSGGLQAGGF